MYVHLKPGRQVESIGEKGCQNGENGVKRLFAGCLDKWVAVCYNKAVKYRSDK